MGRGSYPSAKKESVYSPALADWATIDFVVLQNHCYDTGLPISY